MDDKQRIDNATIAYYAMSDAQMSDSEYDALFEKVYGDTTSPFELYKTLFTADGRKRDLALPMLSLTKARTGEEVTKWVTKVFDHDENAIISFAPKYDGLACLVEVRDGKIVGAVTRGDGAVGEDVTYAVQHIATDDAFLVDGFHRVEVCMSVENMRALNGVRGEDKSYNHPRNAAAGVLRLSSKKVAEYAGYLSMHRHFSISDYDVSRSIVSADSHSSDDVASMMSDYRDEILARMNDSNHAVLTDGIVLFAHDADGSPLEAMGDDGAHPRWAIAWKFPNEAQIATITDVHWQSGRTKNTPVATFNPPVDFDGVMVSHASLHNADNIAKLGVQIGDQVELVRSNEVIPYVRALHKRGEVRTAIAEEPDLEVTTRMLLSLAVNVLDVRGLGGTRVDALADLLDDEYDMGEGYELAYNVVFLLDQITTGDELVELNSLDRVGATTATAIAESVQSKMAVAKMYQWLACLGLPGVGRTVWSSVLTQYDRDVRAVIHDLENGTFSATGVGPKRVEIMTDAVEVIEWLVNWIEDRFGLPEEDVAGKPQPSGTAVVTGKIEGVTRSEIADVLAELGWSVGGSITETTDVLFNAGGRESSKTKSAAKKNVTIVAVSAEDGLTEIIDWIDAQS